MAVSSAASHHNHRRRNIAVKSFVEDPGNRVDIFSLDEETTSLKPFPTLSFEHPYSPTKLMFQPPNPRSTASPPPTTTSASGKSRIPLLNPSPLSTTAKLVNSAPIDLLRLERLGASENWDFQHRHHLHHLGHREGGIETQLIAHDKEVYDIAWGEAGVFASLSADDCIRIFDLRDKEHSTIIYKSPQPDTYLLRLAWNKQDLRYMATILMYSNKVVILDIRSPTMPVAELEKHQASDNTIALALQSCRHICSVGDDGQALIWELPTVAGPNGIDPMSMYLAGTEVSQLQWSATLPDWIAIAFSNKLQMLRV